MPEQTKNHTAAIAKHMLEGNALYQVRARKALPLLVRNALAQTPLEYGDLAEELGLTNPRNLNYILGSVGTTLEKLEKEWDTPIPIPPIQSLVVNKNSGLPGKGFFSGFVKVPLATKQQRLALLREYHSNIYAYPYWLSVLTTLDLDEMPAKSGGAAVEKARHLRGTGEGEAHKLLKEYVFNNPALIGLKNPPRVQRMEYPLPSGDRLDVFFESGNVQYAVEVKSHTSSEADIARGLFQCLKYELILNKWRAWERIQIDIRVLLVLQKDLPPALVGLRNTLGIEVVENVEISI